MTRNALSFIFFTLFLTVWVIALYWPGLYGPFFLDDLQTIDATRMSGFSWKNLMGVSLQNETGPVGRPFSVFTLALNGVLFGPNPFSFKVVNLVIHLLCGGFIGTFIYLLVSALPGRRSIALSTALLTACLWLIHPLQVSTVLYAVQRMTQLSALFTLLALNAYLYGRLRQLTYHRYWQGYIFLSFFIFFPLAILSKETGVLFIFYLFCVEYFILHFRTHSLKQSYYLKHFHRLLCLSCILIGLACFYYLMPKYLAIYQERDFDLISRLLTESKALVFYLILMLRPAISNMGIYHDDFPISTGLDPAVIASFCILLGLLILAFYARRRSPILSFGIMWFFISHLMESTLIPLELVFEHRNYLALMGVVLIPSFYLNSYRISQTKRAKIFIISGIILLLVLLSGLTVSRTIGWSSDVAFLQEAYAYHRGSPRVHVELGNWHLEQGRYAMAMDELDKAFILRPHNTGILLNKLLTTCYTHHAESHWYDNINHSIQRYPITPYSIVILNQIVKLHFAGRCQSVHLPSLQKILENAQKNPNLDHRKTYQAVFYHLEAGVVLLMGDRTRCRELLMKSFLALPTRLDPLIEKARLEWNHGLYQEALATRELIRQHDHFINVQHEKLQALDDLFASRKTS